MDNKISRIDYFVEVAKLTARRSSCHKKQVGGVLVSEGRIIATGYNGVLPNNDPALGIDELGVTHTVHCEANIIAFCAKNGIPTNNTTMYVTLSPCEKCAELIVQAGIKTVFYIEDYRDDSGLRKLLMNNVEVDIIIPSEL